MGRLLPVLWALLASAELAGSKGEPGVNLSCYQCFKVAGPAGCRPTACLPTDQVCLSNAVVFLSSKADLHPEHWRLTVGEEEEEEAGVLTAFRFPKPSSSQRSRSFRDTV